LENLQFSDTDQIYYTTKKPKVPQINKRILIFYNELPHERVLDLLSFLFEIHPAKAQTLMQKLKLRRDHKSQRITHAKL
jgi:hypothetical protein